MDQPIRSKGIIIIIVLVKVTNQFVGTGNAIFINVIYKLLYFVIALFQFASKNFYNLFFIFDRYEIRS